MTNMKSEINIAIWFISIQRNADYKNL